MKTLKRFFWGILFLCLALSCSDEGGTIDNSSGSNTDQNFAVFSEIFQNFLDGQAANTFVDETTGLTFINEQPCGITPQPGLHFNDQYYNLNATTCFYYFEPGPESYEAFSVVNSSLLANGLTVYAVASFINQGIPETGAYEIEFFCEFFCYSTVSIRVYFLGQQNETVAYYVSDPTTLDVVNKNGKVTVNFDSDFYSVLYPYADYAHISGSLSCCN